MSPSPYRPVAPIYRPGQNWMTVPEVAEELRLSRMSVYRRIHEGALVAAKFGGCLRVSEQALDRYLRESNPVEWVAEDDGGAA